MTRSGILPAICCSSRSASASTAVYARPILSRRLGGDEFAVLQTNLGDVASAGVLAQKIQDALSAPYPLGETEMRITVSIGISPYTSRDRGTR